MKALKELVRPSIWNLKPYSSARDEYPAREEAVFMDANENPYNYPYNRYPDPLQLELKEKIGKLKKVNPNCIFLGNGSDEAIDLLIRIFCEPRKDNIIIINPTYGMYKVCADVNDVETRFVNLTDDFQLNVAALLKAQDNNTKLTFICSPNNPTANTFKENDVLSLLKLTPGIVIVDEAYIDFSSYPGVIRYLGQYPNLVILQTFSKAWGMAGIRLGMALADAEIIRIMNKVKYPYNVSFITQKIALNALRNIRRKEKWVAKILAERTNLMKKLAEFSFTEKVYESDANFFLAKVKKPVDIYKYLVKNKIIIRDRSNVNMIEGCLRITIGTKKENNQLIKVLRQFDKKQK